MDSDFRRVAVGVVGLGRFGRLHALTLAGLAEADLVALVAQAAGESVHHNSASQGTVGRD